MTILNKIKKTIKKYNLIDKNDKILAGVSGGPDSVALLYLLKSLSRELKLKLHLAHLDHCLRKDSYKDREFVEDLARKLKIPLTCAKIQVKKLAKKGSLEEVARNVRLAFLFKVARDVKADKIALGHNFDDQAETVLMRILRGSGLYGLSGILPKRNIRGFEIIRPLIEIPRREIESYLRRKKIQPRIDKSNLQDIYLRNKIRHKLLPLLERAYNKNIRQVLSNMAESISYDYDYLRLRADIYSKRLGRRVNLNKYSKLHPAVQRMVLRLNIARLTGSTRRLTFRHIKEIEDLILNRPVNSIVDLPKGISIVKKEKCLLFYRRKPQ